MSAIFLLDLLISLMAVMAFRTTPPPLLAFSITDFDNLLASAEFSAFCCTVLVNSSMAEAVSSKLEACDSVR